MLDKNKINNHPALTFANELQSICQPLNSIGISYFSHVRIDSNCRFAGLGLKPEFLKLYLEKKYYNYDIHLLKLTQPEHYILWDSVATDKKSHELADDFRNMGFGHGFTIIQNHSDFIDCYHFATKLGFNKINQRYFLDIELLKKFINYFTDTVNTDRNLSQSYDFKFTIDNKIAGYFTKENIDEDGYEAFNEQTNTNRIYLEHVKYITNREWQCLYWLSKGKTLKEIATVLAITERTVKAHLTHIKEKFSFDNLFQLGILFEKLKPLKIIGPSTYD